uniref:Uncharacterized protein n=1 Tax=Megaselia scalaris TaxID=36166 RepID=T1GSE6_MEGSC
MSSALLEMTLQNTWSCVKALGRVTEKFQTLRGFCQGDELSWSFFNTLVEMILRAAEIETKNIYLHLSGYFYGLSSKIILETFLAKNTFKSFAVKARTPIHKAGLL